MKVCPFCAEEIQDAAIKCRFCGEFLSMAKASATQAQPSPEASPEREISPAAPSPAASEGAQPAADAANPAETQPKSEVVPEQKSEMPITEVGASPAIPEPLRLRYNGRASWRAFFREYAIIVGVGVLVPFILRWLVGVFGASSGTRWLAFLLPFCVAGGAGVLLTFYARSLRYRITKTTVESETGLLFKKIRVVEISRLRNIRYHQSFLDRVLRVAHIALFTDDTDAPEIQLVGVPASRRMYSELRAAMNAAKS